MVVSQNFEETGRCSFYADKFQGRNTTGGEKYNKWAYTGAHRTLPFGTKVEITNLSNNNKVVVRINDRGPATKNRIIDVSRAAAEDLGIIPMGVVKVSIRVTDQSVPAPKKHEEPVKPSAGNKPAQSKVKTVIYDHDMNVCSPTGYGVAVGYFQSLENCKKALTTFEQKYNAPGFINELIRKDSSEYILIIGCLEQKKGAAALLRRLKKDLPEAHIVSF
ncbi:MAG: septal ring lytic transglycosylase RlpA family protein [Bacteroidota bacterium]